MKSVVAIFGEALIDFIQLDSGLFEPKVGGSPLNVARAFSKLGAKSHYLSPISTDPSGDVIYKKAVKDGIDLPDNNRSNKASALAMVYHSQSGKPEYTLYRQGIADLDITLEQLQALLPEKLDLFHTGSLALVPEMVDILISIIRDLKRSNVKISIDVNVRSNHGVDYQQYMSAIWRIIELADIVKVSDEDLELMGLLENPELHARQILEKMTNGLVVLTLGEKGSRVISDRINMFHSVIKPRNFVDTIGAGDTFFATFLAQMLRENIESWGLHETAIAKSLKYASVAAALNIERHGCQPPSSKDIETQLALL